MSEEHSKSHVITVQVNSPDDLDRMKEFTTGILGEACWEARLGYGDELKLEIGAKKTDRLGDYGAMKLKRKFKLL
jgi:hypothetical protein